MKVVALAGGVGGAKLADGLARVLPSEDLTVIVNSGDDFEHWGLKICPDLDTVCYTLGGLANPETGWGRADESWQTFEALTRLGGTGWFRIGDKDLGTHLERTRRLRAGERLSEITGDFCRAWGIQHRILPMSDDPIATMVHTDQGVLPFQEYFVHQGCRPRVTGFEFRDVDQASPAAGVLEAVERAELVILCPSNPWVSIDPILAVPTLGSAVRSRPVVAVSPIIGGKALKGPAAKMYAELGIQPSAYAVARHYDAFLSGMVFDVIDHEYEQSMAALGIKTLLTNTIMLGSADRKRLAEEVLQMGEGIISDKIKSIGTRKGE